MKFNQYKAKTSSVKREDFKKSKIPPLSKTESQGIVLMNLQILITITYEVLT